MITVPAAATVRGRLSEGDHTSKSSCVFDWSASSSLVVAALANHHNSSKSTRPRLWRATAANRVIPSVVSHRGVAPAMSAPLLGLRIAVVGAGPAGVCAAVAAVQSGAEVVWIDQIAAFPHASCDHDGLHTGFGTVGRFGHFSRVHRCDLNATEGATIM